MRLNKVPSSSGTRVFTSIVLLACIANGCSSLTKTNWPDLASFRSTATKNVDRAEPKSKPLSNSEQRKLCISTAEQLVASQHWAEAVKLYEKAEALGKPGQHLDRELAPALAANKQFTESIHRYQRLLEKNPKENEIEINLAWTLIESGNHDLAEQHLRNVIARNPKNQNAIANLALLMARSGRTTESFDLFKQIVGESAAHHNIGVVLLEMGNEEMAKVAFANATACPDASTESHQFLAALQSSTNEARISQR